MSVPWQTHWTSDLLARWELARLAPDTLVRTTLIVGVTEFIVMFVLDWLSVRGLMFILLDTLLLTVLSAAPLYYWVSRRAAQVAARAAAAPVEAHFRGVVDAVSDAIVVSEAAGTILFCNPSVQAVFGAEPVLLRGQSLSRFLPSSSVSPNPAGAAGAAAERMGLAEREACRWDGSRFPAEVSSREVRLGDKRFLVTVIRDVTARKQAQEALRQSEQWLAAILAASRDGIVVEEKERIAFANKAFARLYGYTDPRELIGRHISLVQAPADNERMLEYGQRRLRGEPTPEAYEFKGLRRDGQQVDLEASVSASTIGSKQYIISVISDIAERKRAEEALRASEERYRTLFEESPISLSEEDFSEVKRYLDRLRETGVTDFEAYFEVHPEAVRECAARVKVLAVNKATLQLYETEDPQDLLEGPAINFPEEAFAPFCQELLAITRGETRFATETVGRTKTGKWRTLAVQWSVAPTHRGTLGRVVLSVIDVTERKRLQLMESLLPVCCVCGKVRDDAGTERGRGPWHPLEQYVIDHSDTQLSHTFCPDCLRAYRQEQGLPPEEPPPSAEL